MATHTLYLTSTATSSPFPTTSRLLSETNNASEVQLGPGEFDSGLPGTSDAGQWNPSSAIGDTTAAAEIDNTGASLGTTRQGWLWDQDLTGLTLAADAAWTVQLRLRANQGTGTAARVCMRVTIVTGSSGAWTTVANLFTTRVTGAASTSGGQAGWRDRDARITVTSTAANFSGTVGGSGTVLGHTFAANERILIEFGFCDADSTADRTWRLDYNTANSFVTTPDISLGPLTATLTESSSAATDAITGTVVVAGDVTESVTAATDGATGSVIVAGDVAEQSSQATDAITALLGAPLVATLAEVSSAATDAQSAAVVVAGSIAEQAPAAIDTIDVDAFAEPVEPPPAPPHVLVPQSHRASGQLLPVSEPQKGNFS